MCVRRSQVANDRVEKNDASATTSSSNNSTNNNSSRNTNATSPSSSSPSTASPPTVSHITSTTPNNRAKISNRGRFGGGSVWSSTVLQGPNTTVSNSRAQGAVLTNNGAVTAQRGSSEFDIEYPLIPKPVWASQRL